jgi:hypothetical protein
MARNAVIHIVTPYEEWDRATAAERLHIDPRIFDRRFGDLGFTPLDSDGREIRMKRYRSTDIEKASRERSVES